MKLKDDIRSVTYLKGRAADLLDQVNRTHRPVVITQNGKARAVVQDPESYERMTNALGILKLVAQGEADARAGRVTRHAQVFSRLGAKLKARAKPKR